jgi:hypothetical protein
VRSAGVGVAPDFHVLEVPGKVSIQLSLDMVDRLQQEVMRGFGAVPRRGAEVGGILLGTTTITGPSARIEDYELVPIEYKRGPSYRFSAGDQETFRAAVHRARTGKERGPIGYFRSHTRDAVGLSDEDLKLLSNYFPSPEAIVLLIRPFASKPSLAGFYFKEAGVFPSGPPLIEFPFRRSDLTAARAPVAKSRIEATKILVEETLVPESRPPPPPESPPAPTPVQHIVPVRRTTAPSPTLHLRPILHLSLGVLLGYQAVLRIRPRRRRDTYSLALSVKQSGNGLELNWNGRSRAIGSAENGALTIADGSYNKAENLTQAELKSGSTVPYHPMTKHVVFRLDVFPNARNSVSETIEWHLPAKS